MRQGTAWSSDPSNAEGKGSRAGNRGSLTGQGIVRTSLPGADLDTELLQRVDAGGGCSVANLCPALVTPRTAARQASFPVLPHLLDFAKFVSTASVMPSSHLTLCHPLLLPSVFPSIRAFSNESSVCIRWPKY